MTNTATETTRTIASPFGPIEFTLWGADRGVARASSVTVNGVQYSLRIDFSKENPNPHGPKGVSYAPGAFGYSLTRKNWTKLSERYASDSARRKVEALVFAEATKLFADAPAVRAAAFADAERVLARAIAKRDEAAKALDEAEAAVRVARAEFECEVM